MSDIVCGSCTIKVPEEKEVGAVFKHGTDEPVTLAEVTKVWATTGLPPNVLMAYLNEGSSHKLLPQYDFRLIKKTVEAEHDKVFDGSEEEAETAGWVQNEFGWCCGDCAGHAHETEDCTSSFEGKDLATLVAVAAKVGEGQSAGMRSMLARHLRPNIQTAVVKEAEAQGLLVDDE